MADIPGITEPQLAELIELVHDNHNFDFSGYSKASLKRRLSRIIMLKKLGFDELKSKLDNDPQFFQWFVEEITVNVTEMFRDPLFYKVLSTQVIPHLSLRDRIRIWTPGCSSGEEVYSLAILFNLAGLGENTFIYGTDIHTEMLNEARRGIYSMRKMKGYEENYRQTEFPGALIDYFTIMNDMAGVRSKFRQNVLFSVHNLIKDRAFNEFDLITCRNVFIYFDIRFQERVLNLFHKSLAPGGYLCLGTKETIRFPDMKTKFQVVNSKMNIYQKID